MAESFDKEMLRAREKMPAVAVDSVVEIVNPDIASPFKFVKGEPSDMGFMLSHDTKKRADESEYMIQVDVNHWRSGVLGIGPLGETYDIKGIGWIVPKLDEEDQRVAMSVVEWTTTPGNDPDDIRGLLNLKEARKDYEMGERLHGLGIRTARTIAVLKLKELVYKYNKYSVQDMHLIAQSGVKAPGSPGHLPESYEPALAIRRFGSKMRLDDIASKHRNDDDARREVSAAMAYLSKEGVLGEQTPSAYLSWFAETLGQNLGRLHRGGLVHKSLHQGNITLDCAIVDLDTVEETSDPANASDVSAMRDDLWGTSVSHGGAAKGTGQGIIDSFRLFASRIRELYPAETSSITVDGLIETVLRTYLREHPDGDSQVLARDGMRE